jgi:hypothetical protein
VVLREGGKKRGVRLVETRKGEKERKRENIFI